MWNTNRIGKREIRRGRLPFSLHIFRFYLVTKGLLPSLNEQVEYSLRDHPNINEFTTLLIYY